jgi:hypothetical protein|tara:strand:+ start:329 stop:694 length:366 start_codon:yes stop_codon:yes gene_type:complete
MSYNTMGGIMGEWIPELMYEESSDGSGSNIPFVMVPENEEMPQLLYVFESRETGEHEPGSEGEDVPVVQWDLHQYADMAILKDKLSAAVYDKVRQALGLQNLSEAAKTGMAITEKIRNNML